MQSYNGGDEYPSAFELGEDAYAMGESITSCDLKGTERDAWMRGFASMKKAMEAVADAA